MSYEAGVGVALCLWAFSTAQLVIALNSRMARNLSKVGLRIAWSTLQPVPMTAADAARGSVARLLRFLAFCAIGVLSVALSWFYVFAWVVLTAYKWSKDSGAPEAVKTYRWKVRNLDMSFDDMVRELVTLRSSEPIDLEEAKASIRNDMRGRGLPA